MPRHSATLPNCCRLTLKSRASLVHRQSHLLDDMLEEPSHGRYAGVRVGEAQKWGPTAHNIAEERSARRIRINEGGRRSTEQPRLHHAESSKLAADRYSSPNRTDISSPTSTKPQQRPSRAALSLNTPPQRQKVLREPSVVACPGQFFADIVAACCLRRSRKVLTEVLN